VTQRLHRRDEEVSLEEWAALPEDDVRELVEGRLVEAELVSRLHEIVVGWLHYELEAWARRSGAHVYLSGLKMKVGARRGRMPDLSIYLPDRSRSALTASLTTDLPSVMIEVVSKPRTDHRRDRVEKKREYAEARIPWYWIVDPQLRVIDVYSLAGDCLYLAAVTAADGKLVVPGCEGLTLDLDALWAYVDERS
jgi:Uma2 family endonuclease